MERRMLMPGVWLTAIQTEQYKTACISINLIRPLCQEEASLNALLPSVLLRGTAQLPDMEAISAFLDTLYGASLGSLIRKRGELQTLGFFADCLDDTLAGEPILAQLIACLGQMLLAPALQEGLLCADYVDGEKINLINSIQASLNDKRIYATQQLLRRMCAKEAYGISRLGSAQDVQAITPEALTAHWRKVLAQSPVEIFYVGAAQPQQVAELFAKALAGLPRESCQMPSTQVIRQAGPLQEFSESLEVTQGKLAMGLRTGVCAQDPQYPAHMLMSNLLGGGVSSKLFLNVREKRSLCYAVSASSDRSKGIMLISAGIDTEKYQAVKDEILAQITACQTGDITQEELENARASLLSAYAAAKDSPAGLENFHMGQALDGTFRSMEEISNQLRQVTLQDVVEAARLLQLDTIYFLKGVQA